MDDSPLSQTLSRPAVDSRAIEEAARLLGKARNPIIFVGGGAMHAGAMHAGEEVRALAEALQAPVIASGSGRGMPLPAAIL